MSHLTTVQVQSESKIEILGQNHVYGKNLRSLTPKTKIWHNNPVFRRFGKYSFSKTVFYEVNLTSQHSDLEVLLLSKFGSERRISIDAASGSLRYLL
jgi:hypothetical protein